jgi:hypothetical protein
MDGGWEAENEVISNRHFKPFIELYSKGLTSRI